jgi:hypothetical protein
MPCKPNRELITKYGLNWRNIVSFNAGPFTSFQNCDNGCPYGVIVTSAPSSFNSFYPYNADKSLVGQYFCGTASAPYPGIVNRGFLALTPEEGYIGRTCNCSDLLNDCAYNGDFYFNRQTWGDWGDLEQGQTPWYGWIFWNAGNAQMAFNYSQEDTVPLTDWYGWSGSGPLYYWHGDPTPTLLTNFVLSPIPAS